MSWFTPTEKWPVPPPSGMFDDIRETTFAAQRTAVVVNEIEALFQTSPEMRELDKMFSPNVELAMRISSSRKYTHFEFPNCPMLLADMSALLKKHGLDHEKARKANHTHYTVSIGTLRIGATNHIFYYGDQRGFSQF